MEVCPNCGSYVVALSDDIGWCASCSEELTGTPPTCKVCNIEIPSTTTHLLCSQCKEHKWLMRYADDIERAMATNNLRAGEARRLVRVNNRPICKSCHQPIKGGAAGIDLFCTKTQACVKAGTAYRYHKNVKRRTHEESLHRAMTTSISIGLVTSRGLKWR